MVEAFAVEVEGTRIAVHGTAFTVRRVGDGAIVDVEHGAVAVRPDRSRRRDQRSLSSSGPFRAPSSRVAGRRQERALARAPLRPRSAPAAAAPVAAQPAIAVVDDTNIDEPTTADGHTIASPHGAAFAPLARATAAEAIEPAPPPAHVLSQASVESHIRSCFNQVYGSMPDEVTLSFSGSFTVTLNPDGSLKGGKFAPTVKPEVVACMSSAWDGRFPAGTADFTVPVHYGK